VGPVVALYAGSFVAICGLMVIYDVDVIGDYLALAVLLAATCVGVAAGWGVTAARRRRLFALGAVPLGAGLLGLLLLLPVAAQVRDNYAAADFSRFDEPRRFWNGIAAWEGTPQALPPEAIVVGGWARVNELRYLQTVEGFTLPGDTSETRRYFHEDIVEPGVVLGAGGFIEIPGGPGTGVTIVPERLARYQLESERVR
jgi:hypothetical protein